MVNRSGPMACPVDQTALVMSDRQGIEIDYCPTCRGVWLDRGELDKIIERSTAPGAGVGSVPPPQPGYAPPPQQGYGAPPPQPGYPPQTGHWQPQGHGHHHGDDYYKGSGYKRKKHWLNEIFD
jgi:Zn-finger nucleic acid-binding protein